MYLTFKLSIFFMFNVGKFKKNFVFNFQSLNINKKVFKTRNNLSILVILTNFVNILTSDAHKKILRIYAQLFI